MGREDEEVGERDRPDPSAGREPAKGHQSWCHKGWLMKHGTMAECDCPCTCQPTPVGSAPDFCPHCNMDKAIRNPSGYCDHLKWPENCMDCQVMFPPRPSGGSAAEAAMLSEHLDNVSLTCVRKHPAGCDCREKAITTALSAEFQKGLRRGAEVAEDMSRGCNCQFTECQKIATELRQEAGEL